MFLPPSLVWLLSVGLVIWLSRKISLSGRRQWLLIVSRTMTVTLLCLAPWMAPREQLRQLPRDVVYLVDGSASMSKMQRSWMARRIASLESLRPESTARAVIVFGKQVQIAIPWGKEVLDPGKVAAALQQASVEENATNLEEALLSAISLFSGQKAGSVILLTDGRETTGDVTVLLSVARQSGLEIFTVAPPTDIAQAVSWEDLFVPPLVHQGANVPVRLVVRGSEHFSKTAELTLRLHGVVIKKQRFQIRPGWQVLSVSVPALQRGMLAMSVELSVPSEGLHETRFAYTEVEGPPQVLFVSDPTKAQPKLATALKRRGMELVLARPQELGEFASRWMDVDAVILFNPVKSSLTPEPVAILKQYVEQDGGGLLFVGLGGDPAQETNTPSVIDPMLPIQFEPKGLKESNRRICVILLIDRSASMLGPRMTATKQAAVALIKQLKPEDLVGVFAFDTKPYVIVEVQAAGQVGPWLVDKLVKLRSSGGTDILPALATAANRLELAQAMTKHIILLSDGNTAFHEDAYQALILALREQKASVSTIGIGAAFINTDFLKWLAGSTGGTFYHLKNLNDLPHLVTRDVEEATGKLAFTEGAFTPTKAPGTGWFPEINEWPMLRGYFTATAKPGSQVDLVIGEESQSSPLLAHWMLGSGRVAAFTSDADSRWSPDWIRWEGFEAAWSEILRWVMRPRLSEELFVWVDEGASTPQLIVEGLLHQPQASLLPVKEATLNDSSIPLSLIQAGPWRWQASLEQVPSGWHALILKSQVPDSAKPGPGHSVMATRRWIRVGSPSSMEEVVGNPPQEKLLRHMAQATGGIFKAPDGAFVPPTEKVTVIVNPISWWLPLVILLLLVDVALRGNTLL